MRLRLIQTVADSTRSADASVQRVAASASHFGKIRLALVEVALCVIVPVVGWLIWSLYDKDLRATFLSNSETETYGVFNRVTELLQVGDDKVLSVETRGRIRFWDLTQQTCFGEFQTQMIEVGCAAYEPHGRLLAIGSMHGNLELWDLDHPDEPIAVQQKVQFDQEACTFTPDGRLLCCVGNAGETVICDALTLKHVRTLRHAKEAAAIRRVAVSPDGRYLVTGDKLGMLRIWDLTDYRLVRTMAVAAHQVFENGSIVDRIVDSVLFLPNGEEFVVVTRLQGISVWNLSSGKCLRHWQAGTSGLHSACLSPDGQRVIAGNSIGEIWTWDCATGRCLKTVAAHPTIVRALACNQDGSLVISGDTHGKIICRQY